MPSKTFLSHIKSALPGRLGFLRRKTIRQQRGIALLIAVCLIFIIGSYAIAASVELALLMRVERRNRNQEFCASFSRATFPDLQGAVQAQVVRTVTPLQDQFNEFARSSGEPVTPTPVQADAFFKPKFPMYFDLELFGDTLDPGTHDALGDPGFKRLYGNALVRIEYDGILPGSSVALPNDPNITPYVVALTVTVPYNIEMGQERLQVVDGTRILGSLWRPKSFLVPAGTGGGGTPAKKPGDLGGGDGKGGPPPSGGLQLPPLTARYSAAGTMKVKVAFSVPQPEPPIPLGDGSPFDGVCTGSTQYDAQPDPTKGTDANGNPNGYIVQDGCGNTLNASFSDQTTAAEVAAKLNSGGGTVLPINLTFSFPPLSNPRAFGSLDGMFYTATNQWANWPATKSAATGTPGGPGTGGPNNVPNTSNITKMKLNFTELIPLAPGRYQF